MRRIFLCILLLGVTVIPVFSQTVHSVTQIEYFVDTDPGQGNASALTADDGSLNESFESATALLNSGSLSLGYHTLFVRVRNSDGSWGPVYQKAIVVNTSGASTVTAPPRLSQAEYFVDTDPGQGGGSALAASDGAMDEYFEDAAASFGTISYPPGLYTLFVRFRNSDGTWGSAYTKPFRVTSSGVNVVVVPPKLTQAEFFIDADPGQGNGFVMAGTDGGIDEYFEEAAGSTATGSYGLGLHTLSVRFRDSDGWGPVHTRAIRVMAGGADFVETPAAISQGECYVDTDPGFGNGMALSAIDGSLDELFEDATAAVPTGSLSLGSHTLFVRFKDASGNWSNSFQRAIDVTTAGTKFVNTGPRLSSAECFVDTDPGQGNGFALSGMDGAIDEYFEDIIGFFPTGSLSLGAHTLSVRIRQDDGFWGLPVSRTIEVTNAGAHVVLVQPSVAIAEYYIDTDPGVGNGISVTADDGALDEWYENVSATITTAGLSEGPHAFGIRFKNNDGSWSSTFKSVFEIQNLNAPAAPQNLAGLPGDSAISLTWMANTEADFLRYRIYAGTSPNPTTVIDSTVGGVSDTSRVLRNLIPGQTYYLRVTAVDYGYLESPYSNEVMVVPVNTNPPLAPQGLSGLSGDGQVTLIWHPNAELDLLRYRIYGGTTPGSTTPLDSVSGDTSRTLTALTNGQTYYFRITAVDVAFNQSQFSNEVTVTPGDVTPPVAPQNLAATAGDSMITLTWRPNIEADFAVYRIFADTTAGPTVLIDSTASILDTTYVHHGLANGTTYYFRIVAVDNAQNQSGYSNEVSSVPVNINPPAPPQGLSVTALDGSVQLSWHANGEGDFLKYRIFGGTTIHPTIQIDSASGRNDTLRLIGSLVNGQTYFFRLAAVDLALNQSLYSTEVSATPLDATPPAIPQSLVATAGDSSISLQWSPNGEADFLRYRIFGGTSPMPTMQWDSVSSVSDTLQTLRNLTPGTTYYFRLTAIDQSYNQSGYSNEVSSVPVNVNPPAPPQNLTATALDGSVQLSWRANGEDDFLRYRLFGGTAPNPMAQIDSSASRTDTMHVIPGLANGQTYFFRVTAVDVALNQSAYSNEVSSVPSGDPAPSAPQNLTAVPADSQVTLNWTANAEADFLRYRIYGGTTPAPTALLDSADGISTTSRTIADLANGVTYYFRITAVDQAYQESGYSNEIQAAPVNSHPPSAPVLLAASAGDAQVNLTWRANHEGDLAGYRIFLGTDPAPSTQVDSVLGDTTIVLSGLTNFVTYYVRISAIDMDRNQSAYSNEVSAMPVGINHDPHAFALKLPNDRSWVIDATPTLRWENAGDPDGQSLSYVVDVAADPGFSGMVWQDTTSDSSATVGSDLDDGLYYWRVTATDGFGGTRTTASRYFRVDASVPGLTAGLLQSPVIKHYMRVYLVSDEVPQSVVAKYVIRNGSGVNLDSAGLIMTAVRSGGHLQSDDLRLRQTGTLIVTLQVADSAGNTGTMVREYAAVFLSKSLALNYEDDYVTFHAAASDIEEDGYLVVGKSTHELGTENPMILSRMDVLATCLLPEQLSVMIRYTPDDEKSLQSIVGDFDEKKIGLYTWNGNDYVYVGGEGRNGRLRATLSKAGSLAVMYNPDHEFLPEELELSQNYPNPFNPSTSIRFGVQEEGRVTLTVYNILGQKVASLLDEDRPAGYHTVQWDGTGNDRRRVATGVYFYRLETAGHILTRKMLLVK